MAETHYLISDASKKVDVEAHVLRYWEEELELAIPRNEMGHRYYTEYYIRLFQQVKQLKEKGFHFKSDTDTEVLVQLIEYAMDKHHTDLTQSVCHALRKCVGAYAIAVIDRRNPNQIVTARQ